MKNRKIILILYLLLFVTGLLFFFAGPGYYASRSYKTVWNLGHVFYYTILSIVLLQNWNFLKNRNYPVRLFWLVVITLSTGLLIEFIQIGFDRLTELGDLWRDILGSLIGWVFFDQRKERISPRFLFILRFILMSAFMIELIPPFRSIIDEIIAKKQFPVLSSFETPFEIGRWVSESQPSRTTEVVYQGKFSCKMSLSTREYSGFSLKYFPGDWEGHDNLYFALFNPLTLPLPITCRIHDWQHIRNGEPYQDRFNKRLILDPGWNQIRISLEEVRNAPFDRRMQMTKILNLGIFATRLSDPLNLYIDEVKLK